MVPQSHQRCIPSNTSYLSDLSDLLLLEVSLIPIFSHSELKSQMEYYCSWKLIYESSNKENMQGNLLATPVTFLRGKNIDENNIKIYCRIVNTPSFRTEHLSGNPPVLSYASFLLLPKHALLLPK